MANHSFETLAYDLEDGVATITLNRPEKLNAFNTQMMKDLIAVFDVTDADDAVKAVIVTGAGRGFCAGADLSAGGETFDYDKRGGDALAARQRDGVQRDGGGLVSLRIYESLKPVIAAVNGPAVGVGVTMQLPMDIRLASTEARFGLVFARRGLNPEAASSWFLPRLVGVQTALEWCYTGRVFSAQAREIVENTAPVSIALTRQLIWRMAGAPHPMHAHRADSRGIQTRGAMGDAREGVMSFLEKRPPVFPNRVSTDLPDIWPHWEAPEFK